jgi:hypothetical protein
MSLREVHDENWEHDVETFDDEAGETVEWNEARFPAPPNGRARLSSDFVGPEQHDDDDEDRDERHHARPNRIDPELETRVIGILRARATPSAKPAATITMIMVTATATAARSSSTRPPTRPSSGATTTTSSGSKANHSCWSRPKASARRPSPRS